MTAQSTGPETPTVQDWQEILSSPILGGIRQNAKHEPPELLTISNKPLERQERNAVLSQVVLEIAMTDSDDRLEYLAAVNPLLADADLDQIAIVREKWLSDQGRERLRALARRCYEIKAQPNDMLPQVSSSQELDRLADLLSKTEIADKTLATCYALVEAYDIAYAAYIIHRERESRPTDSAPIQQSLEEIAEDLRFTRLR